MMRKYFMQFDIKSAFVSIFVRRFYFPYFVSVCVCDIQSFRLLLIRNPLRKSYQSFLRNILESCVHCACTEVTEKEWLAIRDGLHKILKNLNETVPSRENKIKCNLMIE